MERTYDIFEMHGDGAMIWKATVDGHEAAIGKLREIAGKTANEVQFFTFRPMLWLRL
jgi:hypothetical protein